MERTKIYAAIESKILFMDESEFDSFCSKNQNKWSITKLETINYCDGNVVKVEVLRSKALKSYDHFLSC